MTRPVKWPEKWPEKWPDNLPVSGWISLVCLCLLLAGPAAQAADPAARAALVDQAAGYALPLPPGWHAVTDTATVNAIARRVCAALIQDGTVPGAANMRAAIPNRVQAGQADSQDALVVFTLSYASLGLNTRAAQSISKDSQSVMATFANALQTAYMRHFPQSIMIDNKLGDDFFLLNVRSVGNFADEAATSRNQYIKMILTARGVLMLMTLYDGMPDVARDLPLAACTRELVVLSDNTLDKVNPQRGVSWLDYLLVVGAAVVGVVLVRRVRGFMR